MVNFQLAIFLDKVVSLILNLRRVCDFMTDEDITMLVHAGRDSIPDQQQPNEVIKDY